MPARLIRRLFGSPRRRSRAQRQRRALPTFEVLEMRLVMAATLKAPIEDLTFATNQQTTYLDLLKHMQDTRIAGTVTKWTTSMGTFYVDLFDNVTPITVQNFINYVHAGAYDSSFFHRSEPGFVLQGGGFQWTGTDDAAIDPAAPIPNEFLNLKSSYPANTPINVRGTLAMAKMAPPNEGGPFHGGAHSATSQWFFNLKDNSSNLDGQNGGFTAFGRVLENGMSIIDAIANLPRYDSPGQITGGAFSSVPLRNYTPGNQVTQGNIPLIQSIDVVPELKFSIISNSNSGMVQASVDADGKLTLKNPGNLAGSTTITVRATDLFGGWVEDTFIVTYNNSGGNRAPTVVGEIPNRTLTEEGQDRSFTTDLATVFSDPGDALRFEVVSNSNPRLVSTGFNGANLNTFVHRYENGVATIVVRATDLRGAFVETTYVVSVSAVNNPPQLMGNGLQDVNWIEDGGSFYLNTSQIGLFSDIDLWTNGDELTISVSNNTNPSLLTTSVSGSVITFTPLPNANGTATVRVRATDKGGLFAETEVTIKVAAVNDAPSFTIASSHTSPAGGGLQTVPNFATNISPGAPNESGQTLTFEIVNNTNPSLFKKPPTISANGTLTYELVNNRMEVAQISVRLKDNGGTANSGSDTSATKTFLISAGNPWQNPNNRFDIDGSNRVDGFDLLALVNELRNPQHSDRTTHKLPVPRPTSGAPYFDIDGVEQNGSFYVNGFDLLQLVNYLRSPASSQQSAPLSTSSLIVDPSTTSEESLAAATPLAATAPAPQADLPPSTSSPSEPTYDARILMGVSTFTAAPYSSIASAVNEPPSDEAGTIPLAIINEALDDPELLQAVTEVSSAWLNEHLSEQEDESSDLSTTAHDAVFSEFYYE